MTIINIKAHFKSKFTIKYKKVFLRLEILNKNIIFLWLKIKKIIQVILI